MKRVTSLLRRKAWIGSGLAVVLLGGSLAAPAGAAPVQDPCPAPVPVDTITTGLTGEGLTTVIGKVPEPFAVQVLGVLDDGIGPDRDLVIIKVSDLPGHHVIDQGGGIWEGMSGSPVYVGGKLLGAVSYGFTAAPSVIGGLTPATDMLDIINLTTPAAAKDSSTGSRAVRAKKKVVLDAALKRSFAARAGVATPRGSLAQLSTPLAVSGLNSRRMARLQSDAESAGLSAVVYPAGSRKAPKANAVPTAQPVPGGNFAAMLSYGDLTVGAIGTTTAVCDDQAVAFGHPFDLAGAVTYGANDAEALAIIEDETFGSFKLANIAGNFGTVDQDRLAGVRANLTGTPSMADITTVIHNLDTDKKRPGTTKVVDQSILPAALAFSIWGNADSTFDQWAAGTALTGWTINGRRADDEPFTVNRSNRWASLGDVTNDPALEVAYAADALVNNEFEDVTIDSVTFAGDFAAKFKQLHITSVKVSINGGRYKTIGQDTNFTVKAGAKLKVKATLANYHSRATARTVTLPTITIPKSARGLSGSVSVGGGADGDLTNGDSACLLDDSSCTDDRPLSALLRQITSAPRNDALLASASLTTGDENDDTAVTLTSMKLQPLTVIGGASFGLTVR